jgi:hypothetical protein
MVLTLLISAVVVAIILGLWFYMNKKSNNGTASETATESTQEDPNSPEAMERKLIALNYLARSTGVAQQTNVEIVIDKCIEVHESLLNSTTEERTQMGTMTGDFNRLVNIHLPEFINVFAKMSNDHREQNKNNFETVGIQLTDEMNSILTDINEKNFGAFSVKQRFMEIRFSDQY